MFKSGEHIDSALDPTGANTALKVDAQGNLAAAVGATTVLQPTVTVSTSPAYTAGDVVGGEIVLTGAVRKVSGTGVFQSLTVFDVSNQKPALTILVFNADPAGTYTDNGAFAFNASDYAKLLGKISVAATDYVTLDSKAIASPAIQPFCIASATTQNLWLVMVVSTTPTFAATTDLRLTVGILSD